MNVFDQIAQFGNHDRSITPNRITCADGFTLSVIAGPGAYCSPRPALLDSLPDGLVSDAPKNYPGPYTAVEVGFPSKRPEPWGEWSQRAEDEESPTATVYGYVPVEMVRALIENHGGEQQAGDPR